MEPPSPTDIASAVGTWVAIALALIALIGIVGPYIVLRASWSDRSQALNRVDGGAAAYVRDRWRLTDSIRLRAVRVPIFTMPPSDRDGPGPRLSKTIVNAEKEDRFRSLPVSSTGWVNLAYLADHYSEKIKSGDPLLIRQQEAWLPMHRFFVLAVGLRGRYGHRIDRGERVTVRTTSRLFTEVLDTTDEAYYLNSPTASKLYGMTGTIWWRQSLDSKETRFDEIYFAPHSYQVCQADVVDPVPIGELFWLAIGCLPIKGHNGDIERVFDLTYKSTRPVQSTTGRHQNGTDTIRFRQRESLNTRHDDWSTAMGISGIGADKLYYLDMGPDTDNRRQHRRQPRLLLASDLTRLAVGVLRLEISRQGFLLPEDKPISVFFWNHMHMDCLRSSKSTSMSRLFDLYENMRQTHYEKLRDLRDNIIRRRNSKFSREMAEICYDLDSGMRNSPGPMSSSLWGITVLSLIDPAVFEAVVSLLERREVNYIRLKIGENCVDVEDMHYSLEIEALGIMSTASNTAGEAPQQDGIELTNLPRTRRTRILSALLWACVRMLAIRNQLDSNPLLETVNRMANIVHISSSISAPIIHSSIQGSERLTLERDTGDAQEDTGAAQGNTGAAQGDAGGGDIQDEDGRNRRRNEKRPVSRRKDAQKSKAGPSRAKNALRRNVTATAIQVDSEASSETGDEIYYSRSSEQNT